MNFSGLGEPLLGVAQQIQDLQSRLAESDSERTKLNATIQGLSDRLEASENTARRAVQVEAELSETKGQCAALRAQLDTERQVTREKQADLDECKKSNAELQKLCGHSESELKSIAAKWTKLKEQLEGKELELQQLKSTVKHAETLKGQQHGDYDTSGTIETNEQEAECTQEIRYPMGEFAEFEKLLEKGDKGYFEITDLKNARDHAVPIPEMLKRLEKQRSGLSGKRWKELTACEWNPPLIRIDTTSSPMEGVTPTVEATTVVANAPASPPILSSSMYYMVRQPAGPRTSSRGHELREQQIHRPTPESPVHGSTKTSSSPRAPSIDTSSRLAFESRPRRRNSRDRRSNRKQEVSSPEISPGPPKKRPYSEDMTEEEFRRAVAHRRCVCVHCYKHNNKCDAEPQCQNCLSVGRKCVRKICGFGLDCRHVRCVYLHPNQYDPNDSRWIVETGGMFGKSGNGSASGYEDGRAPVRTRRKGSSYRPGPYDRPP
ncbi:hypothetical protein CB0940_03015 [Cercospora beticola]|uniref:Uncharacterized protein n=1 Tax=Cercospora beticola TaxID=122368 RepID=A0A2G5I3W2_CERBT|nr:hypothetical protein CB0940_03015 [Cercospora beticola]PIA99182.1 hypothetical protein CB0940_03015 [Cercospora beticola]WPB00182.1 hypothetical protein RHO25_004801 [Cercospora beticola]CAK1361627.1 unnamed protein product [Cercospora beticola]